MAKPQQQNNAKPYTPNEKISLEAQLEFVLRQIKVRRPEIEGVLPVDMPFDKFHATINQALRNNPKILSCSGVSIVNACVKSAYDGLRLDGKEAAIVAHKVKVKVPGQPDKWEEHAEYFPMVRGLIKKILLSGRVIAMEVAVIHANDGHRVVRGTSPEIYHEPLLVGDRGPAIAYYSVATLEGGHRTAEIMTMAEVLDVKQEAKTAFVWDRWFDEMGKKSVIRRHEKRLPSGRDMIDMEAKELFPQFDRTTPHPALAAPARPTRDAISDQSGTTNGTAMDFGNQPTDDREKVEVGGNSRETSRDEQQGQRQQKTVENTAVDMPADAAEWDMWAADMHAQIRKATSPNAVNDIASRERPRIEAYSGKAEIQQTISDRIADLVSGGDDSGAAAAGDDDTTAAGAN